MMKKLIRNIIREQHNSNDETLPEKVKLKLWKMFDRIGIDNTMKHIDLTTDQITDLVVDYYQYYEDPKYNPEMKVTYTGEEISHLFDHDMQGIVKDFLKGDWDYPFQDCFDYDSYWMLDDINVDNMSFMRKRAIISVGEDEDEIEEYIGERFGDIIGCAHSEAQQDADTNELHKDIMKEIENFFSNLNGKWSWDKSIFDISVTMSDISNSEYFIDNIWEELEYGGERIDPDVILDRVFENEWDNAGYDSVFFPDKIYFDEDKHFRYGGAGDISKEYLNEILYDRLQEEIDTE
jgi:hypothetical protein